MSRRSAAAADAAKTAETPAAPPAAEAPPVDEEIVEELPPYVPSDDDGLTHIDAIEDPADEEEVDPEDQAWGHDGLVDDEVADPTEVAAAEAAAAAEGETDA